MFSKMGKYKACGIFSQGHCVLIAITISSIILTLKHTMSKSKEDVCKIITRLTIIMCILEAIKVIYSISQNSLYNVKR